jgi:hypothetical protein
MTSYIKIGVGEDRGGGGGRRADCFDFDFDDDNNKDVPVELTNFIDDFNVFDILILLIMRISCDGGSSAISCCVLLVLLGLYSV